MKKSLFVFFAFLSALALTSCKGEKGDPGEPGLNGEGCNWKVIPIYVDANDWSYTQDTDPGRYQWDNNYFYAQYDVPSLSNFIFTDGSVEAYLIEEINGAHVQRRLPYSCHKEAFVTDAAGNESRIFYTETYDFVFGKGWVEFTYRASDFAYEDGEVMDPATKPEGKQFRLVFNW